MESQQHRKLPQEGSQLPITRLGDHRRRSTSMTGTDLTPHILVVDDDPIIAQQLERLYTHTGYRVTVASLAEDAIELLGRENIDLVITDIRLPGLSGVELAKKCAEQWSD